MSEPSRPATPPEPEPRPRASYANPGMRISDAERAEVSDRLSTYYSEGRLDEAEFSKRLDQAMHAVTQADLSGLFDDLPQDADAGGRPWPGPPGPGRASRRVISPDQAGPACRRRSPLSRVLALAVLIVIAGVVGSALSHLFFPWILIAVIAVLWLRRGPRRRSRPVPPQA